MNYPVSAAQLHEFQERTAAISIPLQEYHFHFSPQTNLVAAESVGADISRREMLWTSTKGIPTRRINLICADERVRELISDLDEYDASLYLKVGHYSLKTYEGNADTKFAAKHATLTVMQEPPELAAPVAPHEELVLNDFSEMPDREAGLWRMRLYVGSWASGQYASLWDIGASLNTGGRLYIKRD